MHQKMAQSHHFFWGGLPPFFLKWATKVTFSKGCFSPGLETQGKIGCAIGRPSFLCHWLLACFLGQQWGPSFPHWFPSHGGHSLKYVCNIEPTTLPFTCHCTQKLGTVPSSKRGPAGPGVPTRPQEGICQFLGRFVAGERPPRSNVQPRVQKRAVTPQNGEGANSGEFFLFLCENRRGAGLDRNWGLLSVSCCLLESQRVSRIE